MAAAPPTLELAFEVRAELAPRRHYGPTAAGVQRGFVAVTGGVVSGPRFSGRIVPHSGGDYPTILPTGTAVFDARYLIEAEDGTLIQLNSRGYRHASAEVNARLLRGEEVPPSAYYMYATPWFDVPAGPHEWLGRSVFLVDGHRHANHSIFRYWLAV